MQTLIIEVESPSKAKELSTILASLNFVKKVSSINTTKVMPEALKEHENIKLVLLKRKIRQLPKIYNENTTWHFD